MNFLLVATWVVSGSPDDKLFSDSAQEAYVRGCESRADSAEARPHFAQAANLYRQHWSATASPESAELWARSEFLAGNLPGAIAAPFYCKAPPWQGEPS